MSGKKTPRTDKEKRDRMKSRNPRENKKGGRKSIMRGRNTFLKYVVKTKVN